MVGALMHIHEAMIVIIHTLIYLSDVYDKTQFV